MPEVFDALRALPCGRRLLDAASGRPGVHLVGGAVRDLLLGREPRELDVVVEGDPAPLAAALGGASAAHERFGTATVAHDGCRFDLAAARAETYARPGALPDVRPAGIDEDLGRRDVTVNAIAVELAGGRVRAVPHALEDLEARSLRVLHEASFRDDPTRLWRVARYAARLDFALEEGTAALAAEAVADGALGTVSGARIGNELRLALAEPDPVAALEQAVAMGFADWLEPDRARVEAALALLPEGEGRAELVVLGACLGPRIDEEGVALLPFRSDELGVLSGGVARARERAAAAAGARRPSEVAAVFAGLTVEQVALAGAMGGDAGVAAERWLGTLRHVRLAINGDDLVAAGISPGPDLGARLARVLAGRLDGEIPPGREAELAAALAPER